MADETGILVFIGIACSLFAAVSAYLIYNHVTEEKEQVYRARVRREKDQGGPSSYLTATDDPKRAAPAIVPLQMTKEEDPLIPDPDPSLEPIVTEDLPPEPEPVQPASYAHAANAGHDLTPLAAAAPPVAIAGAAGAVAASNFTKQLPPPPPPQEKPPQAPKKEKSPKKENASKKSDDFDDYRNFSPQALPPPKGAPPPAAQYAPPLSPVHIETESVPMRSLDRAARSDVDREGLRF